MIKLGFCGWLLFSILLVTGCTKNSSPVDTSNCDPTISYGTTVAAIISSNCNSSSCHGGRQNPTLTTYTSVFSNRDAIFSQVNSGSMPQGHTMGSTERQQLLCWIKNGAANN